MAVVARHIAPKVPPKAELPPGIPPPGLTMDQWMDGEDGWSTGRDIRRNPAQLAELTAPPENDDPNATAQAASGRNPAGYASGLTGGRGPKLSYAGGRRGAAPSGAA